MARQDEALAALQEVRVNHRCHVVKNESIDRLEIQSRERSTKSAGRRTSSSEKTIVKSSIACHSRDETNTSTERSTETTDWSIDCATSTCSTFANGRNSLTSTLSGLDAKIEWKSKIFGTIPRKSEDRICRRVRRQRPRSSGSKKCCSFDCLTKLFVSGRNTSDRGRLSNEEWTSVTHSTANSGSQWDWSSDWFFHHHHLLRFQDLPNFEQIRAKISDDLEKLVQERYGLRRSDTSLRSGASKLVTFKDEAERQNGASYADHASRHSSIQRPSSVKVKGDENRATAHVKTPTHESTDESEDDSRPMRPVPPADPRPSPRKNLPSPSSGVNALIGGSMRPEKNYDNTGSTVARVPMPVRPATKVTESFLDRFEWDFHPMSVHSSSTV